MQEENTAPATWEDIAPSLVELTSNEDRKTSLLAWQELRKMAHLADRLGSVVLSLNMCLDVLRTLELDHGDKEHEDIVAAIEGAEIALSGKSPEALKEEKSPIIKPPTNIITL